MHLTPVIAAVALAAVLFRYLEATRLMDRTVTSRIGERLKDRVPQGGSVWTFALID